MWRGLVRSNTATAIALLITIGLALTAVFYAFQSEQHAQSAQAARNRTLEELWNSQLARARALRLSGKVGRRQESLSAITNAVSIRPSPELRDEAIATLALLDIQPGALWRPASPSINAYALSPRLNYYALGDFAGKVTVCAATNGSAVIEFARNRTAVSSAIFSPDEGLVAARWDDGAVEVWVLADRRRIFEAVFPQRERGDATLAFHPDSRRLAVACADATVRVIQFGSKEPELTLAFGERPWTAAFDPAGTRLAVGVGRRIELVEHPTGRKLASFETPDGVGRLGWHPFGHLLAAGTPNGNVMLVDVRTGRIKPIEAHTQRTIRTGFHPSGRLLVSASWDGRTRFWDAGSGRPLLETQTGFALQFDDAGQRLGYFREGMGLGDWNIDLDQFYQAIGLPLGGPPELMAVALSQEGRWLAATTRESLHLWECRTGRELDAMKWTRSWGAAFTTDDQALLLSSDTGLYRVPLRADPNGPGLRFGSPEPIPGAPSGAFGHGSVTQGNPRYFGAEGTPNHAFVDLAPPHPVRTLPGRWDNSAPSILNGRLASTSRWKGQGTRIWDLETRQPVKTLPDEGGVSLFSPDGRWLVVGTSTEFLFYETATWQLTRRLPRDSASAISGLLAFSPDGGLLAVTHTLRRVRLLAPETGVTVANLDSPSPERVTALAFSGDGTTLAAATDHSEIQIWQLRALRQRLAAMHLDWPEPASSSAASGGRGEAPLAASPPAISAGPFRRLGAIWLSGGGAFLAFLFALYSIRHHRRLVNAYAAVEEIAAQRRRELESTQMQLLHSQKMKALGTLAAGIAHDFNNLLSIIRMAGQLVKRQLKPTGLAQENLDAIEQAVARGKTIAGSILGYSRHAGDVQQHYAVGTAVSDTLAMLSQQFLSGIVLTLELEPTAPPVHGDKSRLEQILLNLLVNAAEAMNGHGKLVLGVRAQSVAGACLLAPSAATGYVELTVRDSGPGIPADILPRIFEPFFTTKPAGGEHGTGLGLTTVYNIAQQDGLGLGVDTTPGAGTTFRVVIPVASADPETS